MRQILIDPAFEKKVEAFCEDPFKFGEKNNEFIKPVTRLEAFSQSKELSANQKQYAKEIIKKYNSIIKAKPDEMTDLIQQFDEILDEAEIKADVTVKGKTQKFHEWIVEYMGYEKMREKELPKIFRTLGIKACVYCNAHLAIVLEEKRPRSVVYHAKFQFDHRFPKSRYPFLCTSFYNLYPTCANCNLAKGTKATKFDLYTTDPASIRDVFRFSIDEDSVKKYLEVSHSCEDINVTFKPFDEFDPDLSDLIENHKEVFKIQEVYDTQKDIAEELVLKSKLYSVAYKKSLTRNFPELFPDINYINRVLVGNYAQPEEIHKRPMAKYMQDIARDLKILDDL